MVFRVAGSPFIAKEPATRATPATVVKGSGATASAIPAARIVFFTDGGWVRSLTLLDASFASSDDATSTKSFEILRTALHLALTSSASRLVISHR